MNIRILILSWTLKMLRPSSASSPSTLYRSAKNGPFGRFDHQARADELLDLRLDVEHPVDRRGKPRGGFRLRAEQAGKSELCGVRHTVQILVRARADPDRRADIGDEAVGVGTVVLRNRPGVRPGAKEQLNEAVIEQVEKARERVVLGEYVVIGFFGGRQRQRALRPEQAEISDENLERFVLPSCSDPRKVGGGKFHERILPEPDELLAQSRAVSDPWPVLERSFELPQHREIIEPPGLSFEVSQKFMVC